VIAETLLPYGGRPTTMKIRPAVSRDRERILQILDATTRFTRQEIGWAMELVDLAVTDGESSDYVVDVAEDPDSGPGRRVQGYVCFAPAPFSDGVYDLYWIAVDPDRQHSGLGRFLLLHVENEVRRRGGRMLLIETSSKRSYAPTLRFYQNAGYREISRIKDFYRIEEDKVVFSKHLSDHER
jgi:ribosomal protein S18 acetylase RimI-like enzyme